MEQNESRLRNNDGIGEVEKSTKEIVATVFEHLKSSANVTADGPPRLFFPNGIELISVVVKVTVKDGVDVEIKVAGEKGVKGALSEGRLAEFQSPVVSTPQITSLDPAAAKLGWDGDVQISGRGFDAESFALFDGHVPKTLYKSDTLLVASLTKEITGSAGTKIVKVHTGSGSVSNEVKFVVG